MTTWVDQQAQAWAQIAKLFECNATMNGPGSTMEATAAVRSALPLLLQQYQITTMLDAPCGDWSWMSQVDLGAVDYLGWDVERRCVERASRLVIEKQGAVNATFEVVNLMEMVTIPKVDLILCRDFFIHLPNNRAQMVLKKFIGSGSHYLLSTTSPGASNQMRSCRPEGHDDRPGYWHNALDLEAKPFFLHGWLGAIPEVGGHTLALYDLKANRR